MMAIVRDVEQVLVICGFKMWYRPEVSNHSDVSGLKFAKFD